MNNKLLLLLIILIGIQIPIFGQSPYNLHFKKEIPYIATAVGLNLTGAFFATQLDNLSISQISALDANHVNSFDRFATKNYSTLFARASNGLEITTQLLPIVFLSEKNSRRHFGQILAMYVEASFINTGLTIITKMTARRIRPFVYNFSVPIEDKLGRTARASFISGHTSTAAVGSFFTAKIFSDFYPESPWKPVVWGVAAVIPGVMGYFRVAAGKHYPTDVIAGYLVGGSIGFLVPHLHKKGLAKNGRISLRMGINSAQFVYRFGQRKRYKTIFQI